MKRKIYVAVIVLVLILAGYALYAWSLTGSRKDKLWLHRCNSLEKMAELHDDYPNIEVDLVYRGNAVFDVTHDEDKSFDLTLDPYFEEIGKTGGHMWLDIKNVKKDNVNAMFHDLDSIASSYGVKKSQLIVEGSDYEALATFTRQGYYTSYYVPFDKPSRLSDEEIDSCMTVLQKVADTKNTRALSFPGWWYDDIKAKLNRDIDLLTWKHRTTQFEFMLSPFHNSMLDDKQLKVILIKCKGSHHR